MESTTGIGLETEGFIVDDQNRGMEFIDGKPASEVAMLAIQDRRPSLAERVSLEQASVMLEIATRVRRTGAEAVREAMEIREAVNDILADHGARLSFVPVLSHPFRFVPATSDPASRAHQLIDAWGGLEGGKEMLISTATASFQINDSRPFADYETWEQRMEMARRIHNAFSANADELMRENRGVRDFAGKTRLERAIGLLTKVKAEQFARHGFHDPRHIVIPPFFANVEAMLRWMRAHSDVNDSSEARPKNEHAVTMKIKRPEWNQEGPWVAETRLFDAVGSEEEMLRLIRVNEEMLQRALNASAEIDRPKEVT